MDFVGAARQLLKPVSNTRQRSLTNYDRSNGQAPTLYRKSMSEKEFIKRSSYKLKLSCSSMKTYEQCARKYFYQYVARIPQKTDVEHLVLGKFVHQVLEDFHNFLIKDPSADLASLMTACFKNCLPNFEMKRESKVRAHEMLVLYLNSLKKDGLPNVLANEQRFKIDLGDELTVSGIADRIDKREDGGYEVCDYKGLAIDTPIPTPLGWTTMEKLKVGDEVFGSDGNPTKITIKSATHSRPCYKLTFSDNSEVICDNVHLWNVGWREDRSKNNYNATLDADELFKRIRNPGPIQGKFFIQNPATLFGEEKRLPIDPWLLGAWLGDGMSKSGTFAVGAQDLAEMQVLLAQHWGRISTNKEKGKNVYNLTCLKPNPNGCAYGHGNFTDSDRWYCRECARVSRHVFKKGVSRGPKLNVPLCTRLRENNLLRNKSIPPDYLSASPRQRLELLRGLMDTDGHWHPQRKRCVFVSSRKEFFWQVVELVRTFGLTVQTFSGRDNLGFLSYRLEFRPTGINPFKLPRKANQVELLKEELGPNAKMSFRSLRRAIIKMEPVPSVPTQCIAVEAKDSLYVCGAGMVLTHNTGKSQYLDEFQLLVYGLPLLERDPGLEKFHGTYIVLKEDKKIPYRFTRTDLDRVVDKIRKIASEIREDQTWEPQPSFLCKWCDYEDICPATKNRRPKVADSIWLQPD